MNITAAGIAAPLPSTLDLEQAMGLLGIPGDPVYIMKDHPDARRRAELLARIAAWVVVYLRHAERLADLGIDDCADLHWEADLDVAGPSRQSMDAARLLNLQIARLAWVHHSIARARGRHSDLVADTASTAIGAVTQLLEAWRDGLPDEHTLGEPSVGRDHDQVDPMLTDGLLMFSDAADRLALALRSRPRRRHTPAEKRPATKSARSSRAR
jgi:hypothetical protein